MNQMPPPPRSAPYDNLVSWASKIAGVEVDELEIGRSVSFQTENRTTNIEINCLDDGRAFHFIRSKIHRTFHEPSYNVTRPGYFTNRFVYKGDFYSQYPNEKRCNISRSLGCILSYKEGQETTHFEADSEIEVLTLNNSLTNLDACLEVTPTPVIGAILSEDHSRPCMQQVPVTPEISALVGMAFSSPLKGVLRQHQLDGISQQLTAVQLHVLSEGENTRKSAGLSRRDASRASDARDRLLADIQHPPSLGALAASVGMTEKRLNATFRTLYGVTVFEMLRTARLEAARAMIDDEPLMLKQVAHMVGYNHVTNFINAFTKHFGKPPRQYGK